MELAIMNIHQFRALVLSGSGENNITSAELEILAEIYESYLDIVNYEDGKIEFVQFNYEVYFGLIARDIKKLKYKSIDEVNWDELGELVKFLRIRNEELGIGNREM